MMKLTILHGRFYRKLLVLQVFILFAMSFSNPLAAQPSDRELTKHRQSFAKQVEQSNRKSCPYLTSGLTVDSVKYLSPALYFYMTLDKEYLFGRNDEQLKEHFANLIRYRFDLTPFLKLYQQLVRWNEGFVYEIAVTDNSRRTFCFPPEETQQLWNDRTDTAYASTTRWEAQYRIMHDCHFNNKRCPIRAINEPFSLDSIKNNKDTLIIYYTTFGKDTNAFNHLKSNYMEERTRHVNQFLLTEFPKLLDAAGYSQLCRYYNNRTNETLDFFFSADEIHGWATAGDSALQRADLQLNLRGIEQNIESFNQKQCPYPYGTITIDSLVLDSERLHVYCQSSPAANFPDKAFFEKYIRFTRHYTPIFDNMVLYNREIRMHLPTDAQPDSLIDFTVQELQSITQNKSASSKKRDAQEALVAFTHQQNKKLPIETNNITTLERFVVEKKSFVAYFIIAYKFESVFVAKSNLRQQALNQLSAKNPELRLYLILLLESGHDLIYRYHTTTPFPDGKSAKTSNSVNTFDVHFSSQDIEEILNATR